MLTGEGREREREKLSNSETHQRVNGSTRKPTGFFVVCVFLNPHPLLIWAAQRKPKQKFWDS